MAGEIQGQADPTLDEREVDERELTRQKKTGSS
jgi:hypothetical protein